VIKIAQKISWIAPEEDTITLVEISRATSIYGTYSVIDTINTTSDGAAKTSANTWVVNYTDTSGTKNHWYKIRLYDGTSTLYTEYSDPTTSEEILRLCTVANVKEQIDTVGRWTDDELFKQITETDDLIYIDYGTPLKAIYSGIGKINNDLQYTYYVGEEDIYRVDRVFYGTTTKTELFTDDQYKTNVRYGMIRILPVGSSGITIETTSDVEVQFVPKIYNKLSLYKTIEGLLEKADTTAGGKTSKELEVIQRKVKQVESILAGMNVVHITSDFKYYDKIYGVNRKKLIQNHDKNKYIGTYGWD